MKSLRWRIALWFTFSLLGVMGVFFAVTHAHLRHELRLEKWERANPDRKDWNLHGSFSETEVDDIAGELWRLSLLYALPVSALALGLGYHLARRALQPVDEVHRQLQAIGARSLDQRVHLNHADVEFRAIEASVNALLARLDASFRQLSAFSAQVAHELRTPLTLIRLQLEEAAHRLEPALSDSLQDELKRLCDYVDQCLLLATAEQGRLSLQVRPVALRALVMDMIEVYALLARSESRELRVVAPEEREVPADERSLRQMLHNLLTNALKHGEGTIVVTLGRQDDGTTRLLVQNRIAPRPAASTPGTTLGLRIVHALAALHPGLVFTTHPSGHEFSAELRWSPRGSDQPVPP